MKYYRVDEDGVEEEIQIVVKECILKGVVEETLEPIEIKMNQTEFNDWRSKW
jgi:hypothetical protein